MCVFLCCSCVFLCCSCVCVFFSCSCVFFCVFMFFLASALTGQFASALAMMFPGDFVSQFVSALPVSPGDLELGALFKDHGVSWLAIDEMFTLEWATYRRCFPAQPPLSALQRYNRRKCAHLLRDLATTADLPPTVHSVPFSFWTLLTGVRKGRNDICIFDVLPLAATVYIQMKLNSALYPGADPFPDPQQPARPPADLLTAIAGLLANPAPAQDPQQPARPLAICDDNCKTPRKTPAS